jgi:hypothetical protein
MSSWKNTDQAASKPKFVSTESSSSSGDSGDLTTVFGVSADEAAAERDSGNPVGHTGWVRRTTGTGGRAGRTFTEVLVAGSMSGDLEDVVMQDFNINIVAHPSNHTGDVNVGAPVHLTVAAATIPTGGTLTYQWQESVNSGSTWANLSVTANIPIVNGPAFDLVLDTGLSGNQYRCVVSVPGGTDAPSNAATLTLV